MAKTKVLKAKSLSLLFADASQNTSSAKADATAPSPSKVPLPPQSSSDTTLSSLLSSLSARIDETESSLGLLLKSTMTLSEQADSLPLLDRAKFFVTITYAIDSLVFCTYLLLRQF